jgi:hypothetical protein
MALAADGLFAMPPPRGIEVSARAPEGSGLSALAPSAGSTATPPDRSNILSGHSVTFKGTVHKNASMVEKYFLKSKTFMLKICSTMKKRSILGR